MVLLVAGDPAVPPQPLQPLPAQPIYLTPISEFNNSGLRDSITKALEGVPAGHGHAYLDISNKGAGVMLVERFNDTWALVVAGRYTFAEGGAVQATLQASW